MCFGLSDILLVSFGGTFSNETMICRSLTREGDKSIHLRLFGILEHRNIHFQTLVRSLFTDHKDICRIVSYSFAFG